MPLDARELSTDFEEAYLENTSKSFYKFYKIRIERRGVSQYIETRSYGRIGTAGQSMQNVHPDFNSAVRSARAKLGKELGKGYELISVKHLPNTPQQVPISQVENDWVKTAAAALTIDLGAFDPATYGAANIQEVLEFLLSIGIGAMPIKVFRSVIPKTLKNLEPGSAYIGVKHQVIIIFKSSEMLLYDPFPPDGRYNAPPIWVGHGFINGTASEVANDPDYIVEFKKR